MILAAALITIAMDEVRLSARVQPKAMNCVFGVQGHHAIVWKKGRGSRCALFVTETSDREFRVALSKLGAKPGENLTPASWNERDNPRSPEPDKRVAGTPVDIFVEWDGRRTRLCDLISEKGRPAASCDFRFGGNDRYQKEFKSGCIACLYSCPGGAVGNHAHPIRDYVRDGVVYAARQERLPKAGAKVTLIFKLRSEGT